jgi:hypothetical protein
MLGTITRTITQTETPTQINYGLMFAAGALATSLALLSTDSETLNLVITLLFGFTVGTWISHLVRMLYTAKNE